MKKIVMMTVLTVCSIIIIAQTNPYAESKIFQKNGYSYKCEIKKPQIVRLYNIAYTWDFGLLQNKATGLPYYPDFDGTKEFYTQKDLEILKQKRLKTKEILDRYKLNTNNRGLSVFVKFETDTKKVSGVYFSFIAFFVYNQLPISAFREMEEVWVGTQLELSAFGQSLKHVYTCYAI